MNPTALKTIAVITVVMLLLDGVFLFTIYGTFNKMIRTIQGTDIKMRAAGALVCYVALVGLLYYFIVANKRSALEAAFLGSGIYAVYESTSYALLKDWDYKVAITDTVWGGVLFYLTTTAVYAMGF
jgi:uncharacterized membrane protein